MKRLIANIISVYQRTISLDHGVFRPFFPHQGNVVCRYHPTCSEYTKEAVLRHGAAKGIRMGAQRILRCHPWSKHPVHDPVR